MAILTDDCDIREVYFYMHHGSNGDFYINLIEYPPKDSDKPIKHVDYRMAMSGGFTNRHPEVREAFVALFRAMQKSGLNNIPAKDKFLDKDGMKS